MKSIPFILLLLLPLSLLAQKTGKDSLSAKKGAVLKDNVVKDTTQTVVSDSAAPKKYKFRLRRGELNFILNRSFVVSSTMSDSISIANIGSGSTFLGAGYNFNINDKFAIHLHPGLNFYKIRYRNTAGTSFPQYLDTVAKPSLTYKRQLMTFVEVPIGVVYTFKRDEKKSRVTYVEAGFFGGFNLSNTFKLKYTQTDLSTGVQHNEIKKIRGINYVTPVRYGSYVRLGRGFVSLYASYRFTPVFVQTRNEFDLSTQSYQEKTNPKLNGLELGIGIVL